MKAKLQPMYFVEGRDSEFDKQLELLKELLAEEAEFLEPVPVGWKTIAADAVVFPQLLGEAYRVIEDIKQIKVPVLAVTSEFGTVAMWDWEIVTYFKANGILTFAPYNLDLTKMICKTLASKSSLKGAKFLVYQDDPGDGMQAAIFKRFYWWEDECVSRMLEKFGVTIEKRSFKELGIRAKNISDQDADNAWNEINWETKCVSEKALRGAVKLYLAIKSDVISDHTIIGAGVNCLNESFYSDSTPCLAWNLLFEENGILWACEADILSLLTKYILYKSTGAPVMMTNLYPFLMGMAALKHERIDAFPDVECPENHILMAHCGYFGLLPRCFAKTWTLNEKVLGIVDTNATAIDARYPHGPVSMVQLHPTLEKALVIEGELVDYVQYEGSDCRNGGVVRIKDGYKMMNELYSHHCCLVSGHIANDLHYVAKIFGMELDQM